MLLVRTNIDHYVVPVSGLQHLDATALQLVLTTRPVKVVSAYLSPTRSLNDSELIECLRGGIPVLVAGDLSAKHKECYSRLITASDLLMHDYANGNCCLV